MSANNVIVVSETKLGFEVYMRDIDTDDRLGKIKRFKTLRPAVKEAQDIVDYEGVEYGIEVRLRD